MIQKNNISSLSDEELIIRYKKSNNQEIIGELYTRYSHLVYGVCLKYLKNVPEAKDTLMHVFEKLIVGLKKYDISFFKSWLYQLAKNECLMKLRKKSKTHFQEIEQYDWEDNTQDEIKEKEEKEEELQLLEKAIDKLNDKQKVCIELFYLKKMSYQEVVNQTNFTLKEVKSAIQNGKRKLKIIMEELSV